MYKKLPDSKRQTVAKYLGPKFNTWLVAGFVVFCLTFLLIVYLLHSQPSTTAWLNDASISHVAIVFAVPIGLAFLTLAPFLYRYKMDGYFFVAIGETWEFTFVTNMSVEALCDMWAVTPETRPIFLIGTTDSRGSWMLQRRADKSLVPMVLHARIFRLPSSSFPYEIRAFGGDGKWLDTSLPILTRHYERFSNPNGGFALEMLFLDDERNQEVCQSLRNDLNTAIKVQSALLARMRAFVRIALAYLEDLKDPEFALPSTSLRDRRMQVASLILELLKDQGQFPARDIVQACTAPELPPASPETIRDMLLLILPQDHPEWFPELPDGVAFPLLGFNSQRDANPWNAAAAPSASDSPQPSPV